MYQHVTRNQVPEGGRLPWVAHRALSQPGVERFHLQREVLGVLGIDAASLGFLDLVDGLNLIESGIRDAELVIRKRQDASKKKGG